MNRGTAITAPLALVHFLFLPVTYSMIFHRGVPNFSYAQAGADDNTSTSWVADGSTLTIDGSSVDMSPSANGSSVDVDIDEVENVVVWTPTTNSASLPPTLEVLVHQSSSMTNDYNEENNASTLSIEYSPSITTDTAPVENISGNYYSMIVDVEQVSDDVLNASLIAFSSTETSNSTDEVGNLSTLWSSGISTTSKAVHEVEDKDISPVWIVDSSYVNIEVEDKDSSDNSSVTEVIRDWNGTCQSGKMQSPIHITTFTAEVNPEAQPIIFVNYDLASLEAVVTPHTIKFDVKPNFPGYRIGIAGGGLMGFYELNHIHLHWSSSEHSIDLKAFKMEAHLVHFKMPYGNLTEDEVLDEPDGIAVLAVLFELGSADPIIDDLIRSLGRNSTEADMPSVMPKSFLPENTDEYLRYRGSLTTPPCSEVVIWTIFPTPKTLTQYQVKWLSTRKLSEGVPDPENYRPVQDRNDREIVLMKASYTINIIPGRLEVPGSSGSYGAPSIALLLASVLCFTFRSR